MQIKEVTTSIGKFANRLGDYIEEAVRPVSFTRLVHVWVALFLPVFGG
ncbi:hypothetical protein RP726_04890 [Candidatus Methylospira mobilis]|nr:hypothetical protein [Candidatus Methylospira mobilis]WNV06920.1 hypothetical protein RP726_04890 [Candidatus Methylospira mobilis]